LPQDGTPLQEEDATAYAKSTKLTRMRGSWSTRFGIRSLRQALLRCIPPFRYCPPGRGSRKFQVRRTKPGARKRGPRVVLSILRARQGTSPYRIRDLSPLSATPCTHNETPPPSALGVLCALAGGLLSAIPSRDGARVFQMHRAATVERPSTEDNITPRREGAKNVQSPPASAARRVSSDDFS
jgi:hypothetical protein